MEIDEITNKLYSVLEANGMKGKVLSLEHIEELREEIEGRHLRDAFDETFYEEELTSFSCDESDTTLKAKTAIVVAVPQPRVRTYFSWNGEVFPLVIPPTYSHATDRKAGEMLGSLLKSEGYGLVQAMPPLKLLAVRCGLAEYGRNNVTYVEGMGSFQRLAAFYTDLPSIEDNWSEAKAMDLCEKCTACMKKCPTNAIDDDRFLLHGERCITFHNERKGEFPDWIDPAWHHCLVGCLYCQRVCPANKDVREWIVDGERFDEKETNLFLEGTPRHDIPDYTVTKLEKMDMIGYLDVLGRNLRVLIKN